MVTPSLLWLRACACVYVQVWSPKITKRHQWTGKRIRFYLFLRRIFTESWPNPSEWSLDGDHPRRCQGLRLVTSDFKHMHLSVWSKKGQCDGWRKGRKENVFGSVTMFSVQVNKRDFFNSHWHCIIRYVYIYHESYWQACWHAWHAPHITCFTNIVLLAVGQISTLWTIYPCWKCTGSNFRWLKIPFLKVARHCISK